MVATCIAVGLILMALLSTSSTAYAGLAVLSLAYTANWIRRAASSSPFGQSGLLGELVVGIGLLICLLFIMIVRPNLFDPLSDLLDAIIFKKSQTSSFYERSHWNDVAWNALAATWGLGIGFGSTRTSSWFAAIISNGGVIGGTLMGIFLIQTFARRVWRNGLAAELLSAMKLSLLPAFMMLGVDAAGPDFGLWMGITLGSITGITAFRPERRIFPQACAVPTMKRSGSHRAFTLRRSGSVQEPSQDKGSRKPPPLPSF